MKTKIAIIGAGISGLVAANLLRTRFDVVVFEKARGVGGRMSTRRTAPYAWDHGAQFFTARTQEFQNFLKPYQDSGLVAEWVARVQTISAGEKPYKRDWFEPHYVAVPSMNGLCKFLARDVDVQTEIEIQSLSPAPSGRGWVLQDKEANQYGSFDRVIVSAPSPQALRLLPRDYPGYDDIEAVRMGGCYAVMVGLAEPLPVHWDIAMPRDSLIGWVANNNSKPGRVGPPALLIHTTNAWADAHIDMGIDAVQDLVLNAFNDLTGFDVRGLAQIIQTHRWRYANTVTAAGRDCFWDAGSGLGVCGDWCGDGRVEAGFQSACALARQMMEWR
jgi:renalase